MVLRVLFLFPLPICILLCCNTSLTGQDDSDPFKSVSQTQPVAKRTATASRAESTKLTDDDRITAFKSELTRIQDDYARMVLRENALKDVIEKLSSEKQINDLAGKQGGVDEAVKQKILQYEENEEALERSLANTMEQNRVLKEAINKLQKTESEAKATADQAVNQRNEMHQELFEKLLYSNDIGQQELAFAHLFACADKYARDKRFPISIYKPALLRRVSELTESESAKVKQFASKCLFGFKPDMAAEMGIQFAPVWHPLEYYRASMKTYKIFRALKEPCSFDYEATTIADVVEEIQMHYAIPVQIDSGVDSDLEVTYNSRGRSLETTLSSLLDEYDLGYSVADEQIEVMKKTNPDLQVNRSYNVAGLSSNQVDLAKLMEVVQQAVGTEEVKLTSIGDDVVVARTSEANQRRIQKQLGVMATQAKWYSK